MYLARPNSSNKWFTQLILAKIAILNSFLIHSIILLDFNSGINYRYQTEALRFHFSNAFSKIRKLLFIYCKILKVFHVIYIQIYSITRNIIFNKAVCNFFNIQFTFITPPTLLISECPFWWSISLPNSP